MTCRFLTTCSFVAFVTFACSAPKPEPQVTLPERAAAAQTSEEEPTVLDEPSEEGLAAEQARAKLEEDRAQMQGHAQIELRRFTPEVRAATKALAEADYPDLNAALTTVMAGPHREPGNPERDAARHVPETPAFFGMTPQMRVLEYGPGAGWYTEILAPTLAAEGKPLVTTADSKGPEDSRQTYYAERLLGEKEREKYLGIGRMTLRFKKVAK